MTEDHTHPESDGLEQVGSYASEVEAHEHALVVLAMGHACWVGEQHTIHVSAEHAPEVLHELQTYADEEASTIPDETPFPINTHPAGWPLYFLWAAWLTLMLRLQYEWPDLTDAASSSNLKLIDHHEWWRPFTSLFLHSDTAHLLGNLLSGIFFTTLVARSIGPFKGWFWILLCGTIGNLCTALVTYPDAFNSIGASTAVFAALGILSGFGLALMLHHRAHLPWLRILSPIIAGVIILGMIGVGTPSEHTDVLGHLFGFLAGIPAGYGNGMRQSVFKSESNA